MSDLSAPAIAIGQEVNKYSPDLASIRFSTSTYGKVVPLGWGTYRLSANVIFASSFLTRTAPVLGGADAHANCMYGVCEGPIVGFSRAWAGQNFYQTIASIPHHPSVPAAEAFLGSYSQNPPAWLSTQFPSQALSYRGLAYISAQQIVFGTGVLPSVSSIFNLPNLNFEVASSFQVGSISALAKTFTASSPTLNSTAHGFTESQNIRLSTTGTLPSGLSAGVDYVCANVAANTYQLKVNPWDANVVGFSGAGAGTHTATPYFLDANPKDILVDFLTNVHYGAGFPSAQLAVLTDFFNYCKASGTFVSPVLETQEAAANFLERLATIGYSGMFFSENLLKFVPYCDTAITGNGITFTPNVTAVYPLMDDDFKPESGDDPVIVERRDPADAFNAIKIEFQNRLSQYSTEIVEIRDEAAIGLYGYRPKDTLTLKEINDPAVAKWVAAFLLFREQAIACTYKFRLPAKYLLLEPMDLLTLTESTGTPLVNVPVRITEASEESDGYISIIAEDFPTGVALGVRYPNQTSNLGYAQNFNAAPGSVNAPVFFIGPYALTGGALEVWTGISGGPNFGGCDVYVSTNNADYQPVGRFIGKSVTGVTTADLPQHADPDIVSTLAVNLSESAGVLASVSLQESDLFNSLAFVGGGAGELVSFVNASLTSPNQYNLTALHRGVYGSTPKFTKAGAPFVYIGSSLGSIFRMPFPPEFNGRLLYFKFLAFNTTGGGQQSLGDVSPYLFTLTQQFVALPPMPIVSGLELFGGGLSTTFQGQDAKFAWRQASTERSFNVGSEPFGGNSGGLDAYFKDYEVRILTAPNGSVLRIEHTTDPFYTYTFEKNFEDRGGVPSRTFTINVYARGQQGQLSPLPAGMTVTNPAPAVPTAIATVVGGDSIQLFFSPPNDTDLAGFLVWRSTSGGFTPGPANLVYQGPDTAIPFTGLGQLAQYFFRVAAFDTFGQDQLNTSSEFSATTLFTVGGIQVVTSLPLAGILGRIVYLTTDGKLYRDNGVAWVKAVDGADIIAATVTAQALNVAVLSAITADCGELTAGSIRGVNVNASSHTTKGSYLTSAPSGGAATLNVKNTADFAASGSGVIIDTTNDRDAFTYTGKTATTLTGCSGVLAHNSGATIIPLAKGMVIDAATNEMRFYGDRGDSIVEELASIGLTGFGGQLAIGVFGSLGATSANGGLVGQSNNNPGVLGQSVSGSGITGLSSSSVGGAFNGNATKGNLQLLNANGSTFPTNKSTQQLAQVGGRLHYSDGSSWFPLTMPYFESSELTWVASSVITAAHGLTDGAGAGRRPSSIGIFLRCKTADLGYSVGDEVQVYVNFDSANWRGFTPFADTTNVGVVASAGSPVLIDKSTLTAGNPTMGSWKIVLRAS